MACIGTLDYLKFFFKKNWVCLNRVLFGIFTVALFVMWCMWDKNIIGNIKRWIEKCVYDGSEILCEIIQQSNITFF